MGDVNDEVVGMVEESVDLHIIDLCSSWAELFVEERECACLVQAVGSAGDIARTSWERER